MGVSLKVDDNGNLQIGAQFQTVSGREALIQDIKTRLRLVQGEFHFDTDAGMPYFELLQNNNRRAFENEIISEVLKDSRVKNAKISNSELKNGNLKLEIEITTREGWVIQI